MQFTPERLERTHRSMKKETVDALVLTRRPDVQYLTGYESPTSTLPVGCVIAAGHHPQLIMSGLQEEAIGHNSIMATVQRTDDRPGDELGYNRAVSFWDRVATTLEELGTDSGIIGLQQERVSIKELDYLRERLPGAGFKGASSMLWKLRQIKDEAEIDAIRKSVRIAEIGIRTALEIIHPGTLEANASIQIEAAMRAAGGQHRGIRAAVLSGEHARFPFAQPSGNRVGNDSFVTIDITVSESGYFAELARTIHTGRPSKTQQKAFEGLLQVYKTARRVMKPGTGLSDVHGKIMKKLGKKIPAGSLHQPIGNSIGLDLREPPLICSDSDSSLREGMVFSLNPSVYSPKTGAIKIADVFVVVKGGVEPLSGVARETL
ncbi:MAG: M24 family metallopeptidase [Candidatus Thorarchaeota archaeon]